MEGRLAVSIEHRLYGQLLCTHHGTKIFDLGVDVHTGNGRAKIVDLTAKEARV